MFLLLAESAAAAPEPTTLAGLAVKFWGPAGVIIVALTIAVIYLYKSKEKVQEKRIKESSDHAERNAGLARDLSVTIHDLTNAVTSLRDMLMFQKMGR